ncbi:MAG TPA: hypothetical protein VGG33_25640, partial [Polyangia bacterium]
ASPTQRKYAMNGSDLGFGIPSRRRGRGLSAATIGALALFGALTVACTESQDVNAPAQSELPAPAPGAVRGEVISYILTMENGGTEEHFYLRTNEKEPEQRLLFAEPVSLVTGQRIDVWGASVADGFKVDRFVKVADPVIESSQKALINGTPLKPRRFAFVLVNLGGGVNITKAEAERRLFGLAANDKSVRQYFNEASYGRQDVTGEVFGPITATMTGCNFTALATSLRAQVPAGYDHYLWYFGSRQTSCGFLGVALAGTPARVQRDTWYNASTDCVVLMQEPAHNFGTMHSSSTKCRDGSVFADVPGGGTTGTCTHNEYGDPYDPMGRGCRHMNSYQKAFQGWFGGCNVVDVTSTGTFTLLPIETPCNGVQALQIKMPKVRPFNRSGGGGPSGITELTHYYLEYRTPQGFDTGLPAMVQLRVSGDIRERTQRGFHTWLLDMNPTTPAFEGMVAGGTFTDPAGGMKFTVMAMDAKSATIQVEIANGSGAATCMDGMPLPTPQPGPESCNATPARPEGGGMIGGPSDGGTPPVTPPPARPDGGAADVGGARDALVPVEYDAGMTQGFKDAGTPSSGTGGTSGGGSPGGNGTGGSTAGSSSGSGGAPGTAAALPTKVSGGCSYGPAGGSGAIPVSGPALLLLGLLISRRRGRRQP